MAAALSAVAAMPSSLESVVRAGSWLSPTAICSGRMPWRSRPPMSARPMLPAPRTVSSMWLMTPGLYRVEQAHGCALGRAWRRIQRFRLPARAKKRRADPYLRRSFLDRRLEVPAHSHRERVEAQAVRAQGVPERPQPGEPCALAPRIVLLGRNAHESTQGQARQRRHGG